MLIRGEGIDKRVVLHHHERDAVRETPVFIGPTLVEIQSPLKQSGVERDHSDIGSRVAAFDEIGRLHSLRPGKHVAYLGEDGLRYQDSGRGAHAGEEGACRAVVLIASIDQRLHISSVEEEPLAVQAFGP